MQALLHGQHNNITGGLPRQVNYLINSSEQLYYTGNTKIVNNYSEIHDLEIKLNFMLNLNRQLSS
jgi:hypothetical protein